MLSRDSAEPKRSDGDLVFVSCTPDARGLGEALAAALERLGMPAFLPDRDVLPASDFVEELNKALARATAMVLLVTPSWNRSALAHYEFERAVGDSRFRDAVVAVLASDAEAADVPWSVGPALVRLSEVGLSGVGGHGLVGDPGEELTVDAAALAILDRLARRRRSAG